MQFDPSRQPPAFQAAEQPPAPFQPFAGRGRHFDDVAVLDPIEHDDPFWRKALTCIPVVGYVMQVVNIRWLKHQEALLKDDPENAEARRAKLLQKAIKYERCAAVGQLVTTVALFIFMIVVTPIPLVAIGTVCYFSSLIPLLLTRNRIRHMLANGALHPSFTN